MNRKAIIPILILTIIILSNHVIFASGEEWTCPNCGNETLGNFCNYCGEKKPSDEWTCPNCGTEVKGNFCNICGIARAETVDQKENKDIATVPVQNKETELSNLNDGNVADWHNNRIKEEHGIKGEMKANLSATEPVEKVFGQEAWNREDILAVYVLDSLENMPVDAVDLSAAGNGSVMGWVDQNQSLYIAGNGGVMAPKDSAGLFAWLINVKTIDLGGNLHTNETTDMGFMFCKCTALETLNMEGLVTDNVISFTKMFAGCRELKKLDLLNFHTQNAESFFGMFLNCVSLETLDLGSFESENVTDFQIMFRGCTNLTKIRWNSNLFSTQKAQIFSQMFLDCESLDWVDVSKFDTHNVTNMYMMFSGCTSLPYLDTSNWDISNVVEHKSMFAGALIESTYGTDGELLFGNA